MKPNFTQASVIKSLEEENRILQLKLHAKSSNERLIEAVMNGFCSQLQEPALIIKLTFETYNAFMEAVNSDGSSLETHQ